MMIILDESAKLRVQINFRKESNQKPEQMKSKQR